MTRGVFLSLRAFTIAMHDTLRYNASVTKPASNGNDSRWESQLRKGSLDLAILAILWERRCYGLEIIRALRADGGVELAEGTLYPILMRLTEESLLESTWVESESGHPRKYYRLTKDGHAGPSK